MTTESHSLQLWPDGQMVTYRGHYPHYDVLDGADWRPATEEENRSIQANCLAAGYVDHEVFCVDSSLVSDLINAEHEGFTVDDIENQYHDTSDWDVSQCRDYLLEHGGDLPDCNPWDMDRAALVEQLESVGIECTDDNPTVTLREAVIANIDDETLEGLDDWRQAAQECAQDNPQEAFEWWRVSQWLCNRLRAQGEVVIDNGYGCWWGRGCTGQSMLMDGTLQNVALRCLLS